MKRKFYGEEYSGLTRKTPGNPKLVTIDDLYGVLRKAWCKETAYPYRLPCNYILHTTGPIWTGGAKNEEALLRGCYINALFKASELGVKSIAFPLISSGTFGFPKDKVLRIALTAISNYLT